MSSGQITLHNSNNSANNNKDKGDRKMDSGERKAAGMNDNAWKGNKNENNPKAADKAPAKVPAGTPFHPQTMRTPPPGNQIKTFHKTPLPYRNFNSAWR